ncbi:MAG TPA: YceH family protein [Solirubrobacteraceae bacterium]|jgi:hypothetical protein
MEQSSVSRVFPGIAGHSGFSAEEVRVLGCLLEKQRTTPEQYPLSLNALRLACNQATNRDPVVAYDEAAIRDALHRLERRKLVRFASGSRAAKYRHLLEEVLPLDEGERAVLTVLLLRGAQTPGELKQRAERMHAFADLAGVHEALERLIDRELVRRLERRAGQKEERYEQLLQGDEDGEAAAPRSTPVSEAEQTQTNGDGGGAASASSAQTSSASGAAENPKPEGAELQELRERVERLDREVAELRFAMRNPSPDPAPGPAHDPPRFDPRL